MMRKKLMITSLMMVCCLSWHQAYAETLHMLSPYYCPLVCDPEQADGREGFVVDILTRIFEPAGYAFEIKFVPYARLVALVNDGEYQDGVLLGGSPHMSDLILPKRTIAPQRGVFLVRAGNSWRYQGLESLKPIRLGFVLGYSTMNEDIDAYLATAEDPAVQFITGENSFKRNLLKLLADRINVLLEANFTAFYQLNSMRETEQVEIAGHTSPVFHNTPGFSPKHPQAQEFARMVEVGLVTLRKNGELAQILSSYGIQLWSEEIELRE
ncbi:ABC transporter substrate-binding protein [Desulfopila sp. IMCC35008]|uniref:substrate-binding periplasmic protein n=1 Tax=Desulfopila sp. IMCC35008 TaxID=2653858 RepID=UPI0013D639A2|nr:transporter substrate-binding domain-containing protein [Desulfopila sp. IMCC35008]